MVWLDMHQFDHLWNKRRRLFVRENENGAVPCRRRVCCAGEGRRKKDSKVFVVLKGKARWFIACKLGELQKGGKVIITYSKTSIFMKFHALSSQHGNKSSWLNTFSIDVIPISGWVGVPKSLSHFSNSNSWAYKRYDFYLLTSTSLACVLKPRHLQQNTSSKWISTCLLFS